MYLINANYCVYIIYDTLSGCAEQLDVNIENIDIFSDQCVCISTRFNSGTVTFEWTKPSNITIYDIMTIRDRKHDNWTQVTDNTFDVSDALLFDSISIIVKVPGLKSEINNTLTYTGLIFVFFVFPTIYEILYIWTIYVNEYLNYFVI